MKTFEQIDLEIDKLVRDWFFRSKSGFYHFSLCLLFSDSKYKKLWREYWNKFNHESYIILTSYIPWDDFYFDNREEIDALTRLIVIEDFKLYCYEHRKRL